MSRRRDNEKTLEISPDRLGSLDASKRHHSRPDHEPLVPDNLSKPSEIVKDSTYLTRGNRTVGFCELRWFSRVDVPTTTRTMLAVVTLVGFHGFQGILLAQMSEMMYKHCLRMS